MGAAVAACALLCGATAAAPKAADHGAMPPADATGVALLELFTSEGCSSCPPADALLARLVSEAGNSGRRVYALSFHVDYWDRLGWKDRFSSAAYTQRQRDYARRFRLASLYTPQLVVNGEREMVGSDAPRAEAAVHAGLATAAEVPVTVEAAARGHEVSVRCRVEKAPAGAVLEVAWVDASASSAPDGGENRSRVLRHVNVVRDLRSVRLERAFEGTVGLRRPEVRNGAVIAWVQAAGAGAVLGATAADVGTR